MSGSCFSNTTMMEGVSPSARAGGKIAFEVDDEMDGMVDTFRKKGIPVIIEPMSTPRVPNGRGLRIPKGTK